MFGIGIPELVILIFILMPVAIVKIVVYKNWQESKTALIISMVISPLAGLYILWKYSTFSTMIKTLITVLIIGICIVAAH